MGAILANSSWHIRGCFGWSTVWPSPLPSGGRGCPPGWSQFSRRPPSLCPQPGRSCPSSRAVLSDVSPHSVHTHLRAELGHSHTLTHLLPWPVLRPPPHLHQPNQWRHRRTRSRGRQRPLSLWRMLKGSCISLIRRDGDWQVNCVYRRSLSVRGEALRCFSDKGIKKVQSIHTELQLSKLYWTENTKICVSERPCKSWMLHTVIQSFWSLVQFADAFNLSFFSSVIFFCAQI